MTKEERLKAVDEVFDACFDFKEVPLKGYTTKSITNDIKIALNIAINKGAEAEAESSARWLIFEEMTKEEKLRLNSHPQNLIMCLFENGDLLKYEEDFPCSALSKVYFLPTP